ncbi:Hypothetical_protein [Hexamita inflata]|uniref:Hypothetical_protein n=1 Tax=Hexamita inflata TaxID=28002 RepID=A0AA86TQU2_9EUKA|nr:Hypothetical protein HINF_LOCUS10967 [Hexamita inflata]
MIWYTAVSELLLPLLSIDCRTSAALERKAPSRITCCIELMKSGVKRQLATRSESLRTKQHMDSNTDPVSIQTAQIRSFGGYILGKVLKAKKPTCFSKTCKSNISDQ